MRLTDQLQTATAAAATLEENLSTESGRAAALADQVAALTAANAALREKLAALPSPGKPETTNVGTQWGFVANDADPLSAVKAGLAKMKADGGGWLRLWTSNFQSLSAGNCALIDAAADLGVRVILCVQPKDAAPEDFGTPDFTTFVARNAARLRKLAYVEVGNELNLLQFRPDDFGGSNDWHKPYVTRWLKPLAAALSMIGVKTLCTSVTDTYHPENYAQQHDALLAAGAADCCDGLALHAYFQPQSLPQLTAMLADLRAKWNKPIYITECNVLTKGLSPNAWQTQFPPYLAALKSAGVAAIQFYRGVAKANGKWTWPVLFDNTGAATEAYALLLKEMKA